MTADGFAQRMSAASVCVPFALHGVAGELPGMRQREGGGGRERERLEYHGAGETARKTERDILLVLLYARWVLQLSRLKHEDCPFARGPSSFSD